MSHGTLEERAREYAVRAHRGQEYGAKPYHFHIDAVVEVLRRFGHVDRETLAAGYLHDVLEDTDATRDGLACEFGDAVAAVVDACTDGDGANRRERKERPYRLIPGTPGALLVKLADRIANVEASVASNSGLLQMYRKEHREFERWLRGPTAAEPMWAHLEFLLMGDH